MAGYVLAIDQGTTSSRAIVFDGTYRIVGVAQLEFPQHFPKSGWVEHDPRDLWTTTEQTVRGALADAGLSAKDIAAIGITNQRETTVVWDRETGEPVYNAIVWQDRRTSEFCAGKKAEGLEPDVTSKTGLLLDPYFSAPRLPGFWTMWKARGRARTPASWRLVRSTAGSSGI
jgi:glycerol kinase